MCPRSADPTTSHEVKILRDILLRQLMHMQAAAAALVLLVGAGAAASPPVANDSDSCVPEQQRSQADLRCPEVSPDGQIRCHLLYRALDYAPFYSFGFGLLVEFTLREMPAVGDSGAVIATGNVSASADNETTEQSICWSLAAIEARKVPDASAVDWKHERSYLSAFGVYLLLSAELRATANYVPETPAVTTRVNTSCWASHRSPDCIISAHVSKNVLLPSVDSQYNPYNKTYWDNAREMHIKKLKAEKITLYLEIHSKNGTVLEPIHYIQPLIKDIPFESLHLVNVNLTGLQMGEQHKMKNLKLIRTSLTTDDAEWFISSAPYLEHLNLAYNSLTTIPQGISRMQKLTHLDLSHNAINISYSTTVFSSLTNLKALNISANPLTNLSALINHLNSKVQLLFLNVSQCLLFELGSMGGTSTLRHQRELRGLDLSHNMLSSLPYDVFLEMDNLEFLCLSHNHLHGSLRLQLPHNAIKILNLSYNYFESPESIVESGTAESVVLKGNKISPWNNTNIFLRTPESDDTWLTKIDISDCKINAVTEEMQTSFQYLQEVDLGGNPFDCFDCSMPFFKLWVQSRYESSTECCPKLLNHGIQEPFSCAHPEHLAKKSIFSAEDNPSCHPDYAAVVGITLSIFVALPLFVIGIIYFYRFEITYIWHLVKIRKLRLANAAMTKNFQYDAFVCYSGKDRNWVSKKLVPQLENGPEKYRLCLHERDFILGSIIARNIASFMQESKNTIIVLTTNFVNSQCWNASCPWSDFSFPSLWMVANLSEDILPIVHLQ